jgi:hypothetical protein
MFLLHPEEASHCATAWNCRYKKWKSALLFTFLWYYFQLNYFNFRGTVREDLVLITLNWSSRALYKVNKLWRTLQFRSAAQSSDQRSCCSVFLPSALEWRGSPTRPISSLLSPDERMITPEVVIETQFEQNSSIRRKGVEEFLLMTK